MERTLLVIALALGCAVAAPAGLAAYLEGEEPGPDVPQQLIRPLPVVPPPVPVPHNALTQAVHRISVLRGHTYKGLTVFPLEMSRVTDRTEYLSVEESLREGLLVITEKGGGSVPSLLAENKADRPILMLAGEIMSGGKQNRILKEDVLLPARSGWVELPVYCVEHGRWSGRGMSFGKSSAVAALNVRAIAQAGAPQQQVWNNVSYYQVNLHVDSGTGDLQTVQGSGEVREAVDEYKDAFRERWPRRAIGMVVARHGRIVGAEIFCNPAVFRKHRDRLLESYAVDCYTARRMEDRERRRHASADTDDAERFLRHAFRAEYEWRGTPGLGRLLSARGAGFDGLSLVHRKALVHAALFAHEGIVVHPVPIAPPGIRRRAQSE